MTRRSHLVRSSLFASVALVASMTATGGASASTKSLSPEGGGVPTTKTDPSKFKNCQEPPADSLWETAMAEQVGLDDATLQKAADYYRDQLQATMRVYRFNCLVKTGTFDPIEERRLAHMFSTTKPTMTLVAGRAVQLGLLSVDDTVGKYFPDRGDEAHRAITVKQLLQHTSGVYKNWTQDLNDNIPDSVQYFMDLKIVHPPGTWYEYSQVGCNMMSAPTPSMRLAVSVRIPEVRPTIRTTNATSTAMATMPIRVRTGRCKRLRKISSPIMAGVPWRAAWSQRQR